LQKGEHVVVKSSHDDWVAIAPPKGCVLWVHGTLVETLPPAPKAPAPPAPVTKKSSKRDERTQEQHGKDRARIVTATKTVLPKKVETTKNNQPQSVSQPAKKPAAPLCLEQRGLVPLFGQGRQSQYEGVLNRTGYFSDHPAKFRLIRRENRRTIVTICFVLGNKVQLSGLAGNNLTVVGREYWVKGEKYPVVVPERIVTKKGKK